MSKNKDQFLTMLVELCRAYEVTYHENPEEVFHGWDDEGWNLSVEELSAAINKEDDVVC